MLHKSSRKNDKHNNKIKEKTMKPRFEQREGQLFRMLKEPVPLTQDSEMPCLCGYIKDKSLAGEYNRRMRNASKIIDRKVIITEIRSSAAYDHELRFGFAKSSCEARYEQLEIIGYPVDEGSKEWALYQMMQGEKVCNPILATEKAIRLGSHEVEQFNTFWYIVGDAVVEGKSNYGTLSVSSWIAASSSTGWQIYKEPEPQYKVGDWVEITARENIYQDKITFSGVEFGKPHVLARKTKTLKFEPHTGKCFDEKLCVQITRKLSPSEVILDFGSGIRGWIRKASNHTIEVYSKANCWLANIRYDMLDTETRKLVESLLQAQEEEKC
jgi:hypothetical protein